jgi:hypothetical protein
VDPPPGVFPVRRAQAPCRAGPSHAPVRERARSRFAPCGRATWLLQGLSHGRLALVHVVRCAQQKNAETAPLVACYRPPSLLAAAQLPSRLVNTQPGRASLLASPPDLLDPARSPQPPRPRRRRPAACRSGRAGAVRRRTSQRPPATSPPRPSPKLDRGEPLVNPTTSPVHPGDELARFWISPPAGAPEDYIASISVFPRSFL